MTEIRVVNSKAQLAEACADDWPRLMFDGFGIMVTDEQEEAYLRLGKPGPRLQGEHKYNWLSGGQRAGKTVFAFGCHADAALYKRGVDNTSRLFWRNYLYQTLAIAPTDALTLRLWQIGDEVSKGAHDSQWDRDARRSRGGAFLSQLSAGTDRKGNGIWRWKNGSVTDFRSSEGRAYRLEGGQWWFITWDEWASQPDREIVAVKKDVLMGRARDHDAKIMPMAWPKKETEHHLIAVIRDIEKGKDPDSQVIYLDATKAFFTNRAALDVELRQKSAAEIKRTIKGEPAGGAMSEFKERVIANLVHEELPKIEAPDFERYAYFAAWDLGMQNDSTVGNVFRIPIIDGRRIVSPQFKARIVKRTELPGSETRDIEDITTAIATDIIAYRAQSAVDATGMGGLAAARQLRDMKPKLYEFKSRSNDRVHGNMRLAAITNGIECLSWGRPEQGDLSDQDYEALLSSTDWGLLEMPQIQEAIDQLASFDRDAKDVPDDEVWSILIGLWYIRRWWAVGSPGFVREQRELDVTQTREKVILRARRNSVSLRRSRLLQPQVGSAVAPSGVRLIRPERG